MRDSLNKNHLQTLISERSFSERSSDGDGFCLSLYMPTHRISSEAQADPIQLKNLLNEAEEKLLAAGMRRPDVNAQLQPGRALLDDTHFWQHQSDGLAVFLGPEQAQIFRLPLNFEPLLEIGPRYHIKPVLPLFNENNEYYLLALSKNDVRFFQGTQLGLDVVNLEIVPKSLAEALRFDDPERQLQFHTGTRAQATAPAGGRPAIFHGHGGEEDEDKDILRYFRKIDDGIQDLLRAKRAPLVLAGVDYLLPIYREANTYAQLADEGITGNPEQHSARDLHKQAREILHEYFAKPRKEAVEKYRELAQTEQATDKLEEIVPAAHYGRIEAAFVARNAQCWGQFDPETGSITVQSESTPQGEDLLDLIAVQTVLHDGAVFVEEQENLPDGTQQAAVFRY